MNVYEKCEIKKYGQVAELVDAKNVRKEDIIKIPERRISYRFKSCPDYNKMLPSCWNW